MTPEVCFDIGKSAGYVCFRIEDNGNYRRIFKKDLFSCVESCCSFFLSFSCYCFCSLSFSIFILPSSPPAVKKKPPRSIMT